MMSCNPESVKSIDFSDQQPDEEPEVEEEEEVEDQSGVDKEPKVEKDKDHTKDEVSEYSSEDETGDHAITDKEYQEFMKKFVESEGFDIVNIPNCYAFGGMPVELRRIESVFVYYKPFAILAINSYNKKNKTHFEVSCVEKVNKEFLRYMVLYITFQAIDKDVVDATSATKTFQARVVDDVIGYLSGSGKSEIIIELCRLKPTTTTEARSCSPLDEQQASIAHTSDAMHARLDYSILDEQGSASKKPGLSNPPSTKEG